MSTNHQAVNVKNDDLAANLLDELLCSIISHIPSLRTKSKLAAVNKKLRRCVNAELNKPMSLKINFPNECLNGDAVSTCRIRQAIKVLAPKTRFSQITIIGADTYIAAKRLNQVLSILAESDCLDQVRSFDVSLPRTLDPFRSPVGQSRDMPSCKAANLAAVLAKCPKLSILRLDAPLCRPKSRGSSSRVIPLYLRSVVANKPLTQLKIELSGYGQEDLIDLFQSLQPNILQTLELTLDVTHPQTLPTPNLAQLFSSSWAVWSTLREIRLGNLGFDTAVLLGGLFGSVLPQLPSVQSCRFECSSLPFVQEIVASLLVLFNNNSKRQQPIVVHMLHGGDYLRGCQAVNVIGGLQQVHPALQVDFDGQKLILELDSVTCSVGTLETRSCEPHCLECGWVYPVVVNRLMEQATKGASLHLLNCRLDRCKVDRVVTDLNECKQRALFANNSERGELVVITFEDGDGDQFYITLGRAHCLSGGCIGCVEI